MKRDTRRRANHPIMRSWSVLRSNVKAVTVPVALDIVENNKWVGSVFHPNGPRSIAILEMLV